MEREEMVMMKKRSVVLLAVIALVLAGCSSGGDGDSGNGDTASQAEKENEEQGGDEEGSFDNVSTSGPSGRTAPPLGHLDGGGSEEKPANLGNNEEPKDIEAPDLDVEASDEIDISNIEGQDLL